MKEASYYHKSHHRVVECNLCPHYCRIQEGCKGICGVRENIGGILYAESYGKLTSIALDSIEKKPFSQFYSGKKVLSVGSYGCNFRCGFCQNYNISMETPTCQETNPEDLAALSRNMVPDGNIGIAYTYNEPFISIEFLQDCAELVHAQGQKNVVVTNGFINPEPLKDTLPFIDAMNIDLKSFDGEFYRKVGGALEPVKETIKLAAERCHVEVTALIISGENDSQWEMDQLAGWLAEVDSNIPLHISRFFPAFQYADRSPTPAETILQLRDVAKKHLNVYLGNM